jgi:hypothetical protein
MNEYERKAVASIMAKLRASLLSGSLSRGNVSKPIESRIMKRASIKSQNDYEAHPNAVDIIIAKDGAAYAWIGEGLILAVEDQNIGIWEQFANSMPWTFKYCGWSARLKRHLWERTGDKLDSLFDNDKQIDEVRYEGQSKPGDGQEKQE